MKELVLTKLKEGSTWSGLGIIVGSLTFVPHATELAQLVPVFGALVVGLLSIYFK